MNCLKLWSRKAYERRASKLFTTEPVRESYPVQPVAAEITIIEE